MARPCVVKFTHSTEPRDRILPFHSDAVPSCRECHPRFLRYASVARDDLSATRRANKTI